MDRELFKAANPAHGNTNQKGATAEKDNADRNRIETEMEYRKKMMDNDSQKGTKYDADKIRMDLLQPDFMRSIGTVMTYGAKEHGDHNWKKVSEKRFLAAMIRHLIEYMEDPDSVCSESKLNHSQHMLCNAAFLDYFVQQRKKLNVRIGDEVRNTKSKSYVPTKEVIGLSWENDPFIKKYSLFDNVATVKHINDIQDRLNSNIMDAFIKEMLGD